MFSKGHTMACSQERREFLKQSAVVAGASFFIPGSLGALENFSLPLEDKFVRSICEMCSSRCPIEVRVVNGKPVWLQGNAYAKEIGSSLCARGVAGVSQLYDKDRLVTPLIRVGKRGENKWREASYDEALELIATKLNELKKRYGAQSVLFSSKTGMHYTFLRSFAANFGSPNVFSHWSSCPIAIESAFEHTFGEKLHRDFENTNYIVNFGHNLFEGLDIALTKSMAQFAANSSKKLVVFDPRFSLIASKANEWYPIKPGSDLAFVLSLIHIWLRDGKYNKSFVERYCIGLDALKKSTKETTPQWQQPYTGIDAHVVERIADEVYRAAPKCLLDWGHKATTSPAEYQRSRAIIIANVLMGNVEKEGGIYFTKTPTRINALVHENIIPLLNDPFPTPSLSIPRVDGAGEEGDNALVFKKHGVLTAIPEAILTKKPYAIHGWFISRHNPLVTVANPKKMKEAMETLDFIVVNDIYVSDTAMMADVILPEATYLERDEGISLYASSTPSYAMRNRAIAPINHTQSSFEILRNLAERMGFGKVYAWKTMTQLRAYQAKGNGELLENLLKRGYVSYAVPSLFALETASVERFCERYPRSKAFVDEKGVMSFMLEHLKTPSGKIELFSATVESHFKGFGVPSKMDMNVNAQFPYTLISGKSAIHTNGHTHNVPYLHMLMPDNPVWMHPSTAQKHGLKQGDTCYLHNDISKEKVHVFITEGIRPDTLFAYMGFGREAPLMHRAHHIGLNPSTLLSLKNAPICGAMITNTGVSIVKA